MQRTQVPAIRKVKKKSFLTTSYSELGNDCEGLAGLWALPPQPSLSVCGSVLSLKPSGFVLLSHSLHHTGIPRWCAGSSTEVTNPHYSE